MVEEETVGRKGKKGQTRYQTWRGCMDVDGAGGMWKCGNTKRTRGENLDNGGWMEEISQRGNTNGRESE